MGKEKEITPSPPRNDPLQSCATNQNICSSLSDAWAGHSGRGKMSVAFRRDVGEMQSAHSVKNVEKEASSNGTFDLRNSL